MHRSELNQVAHGLKAARPSNSNPANPMNGPLSEQWENTVTSVADHLKLKDKARSNFLATAGLHKEVQS